MEMSRLGFLLKNSVLTTVGSSLSVFSYFVDSYTFQLSVTSPALHLAVMQGRLNNVRALLTESNIDAEAFNLR